MSTLKTYPVVTLAAAAILGAAVAYFFLSPSEPNEPLLADGDDVPDTPAIELADAGDDLAEMPAPEDETPDADAEASEDEATAEPKQG